LPGQRGPEQMRQSFPGSNVVVWRDFAIEIVERGAHRHRDCLDRLREEVLRVAAESRGWDDPQMLEFFRKHFKIGPLYEADALVLVSRGDVLVGLAGTVNEWAVAEGSIVHLCSLGLLPQVQRLGLLPGFMSLLWLGTLREPKIKADLHRGRLYTTAITQSPYIIGLMQRIADIYPSPDRSLPNAEEQAVARAVRARFDPEIPFDEVSFILSEECAFRYRKLPASLDRRLTQFCTERLRYERGDVFVVVGTVRPDLLLPFIQRQRALVRDLTDVLLAPVLASEGVSLAEIAP
jgi:hypothetical protein